MLSKTFSLEVTPCLPAVRSRAPLSAPITLNSSVGECKNRPQGPLLCSQACMQLPMYRLYNLGEVVLLPIQFHIQDQA